MGIFDRFKKNKTKIRVIPEQDQVTGYEPIPRYPDSVMVKHSEIDTTVTADPRGGFYIEYESMDHYDRVVNWFKNQMESKGWKIAEGTCGGAGFVTLVYEKKDITCSVGTKYRPSHSKIWVEYRKP